MRFGNFGLGKSMEDERVRGLFEKVINFNWERPQSSQARTEFKKHRADLIELWRNSTDEAEKARLWSMYKEPAPAAVRAEYDEIMKPRREFQRALRRDFPEWHYSDGSLVRQFVGGEVPTHGAIQPELRDVWQLASAGEAAKAKRKLRRVSESFVRKAERALSTTASWYNLEKHEKEVVPREPRPKEAATLRQMEESLEWLQRRLGSLKVCENPKCASGRKYFFKVYPNDRYCCTRCIAKAKALRQAKRDAESQKPSKMPTFTEEHRKKMAIAAEKRWAKVRATKGKKKYETS